MKTVAVVLIRSLNEMLSMSTYNIYFLKEADDIFRTKSNIGGIMVNKARPSFGDYTFNFSLLNHLLHNSAV